MAAATNINQKKVNEQRAIDYGNVLILQALEYFATAKEEDLKDRSNYSQLSNLRQFALKAEAAPQEKVLPALGSFLSREKDNNPPLCMTFCKELAKSLTSAVLYAQDKDKEFLNDQLNGGFTAAEAKKRMKERFDVEGAITDVTNPQFKSTGLFVEQAAYIAHALLNEYFVHAERNNELRSRRIGSLPWGTFNIGDDTRPVFVSKTQLDDAIDLRRVQRTERQLEQSRRDEVSAASIADDFGA